jgi:hypothetical protein
MSNTHGAYVELIKDTALSIGKQAVMKYLVSQFPWMGVAFINPIIGMLVGYVLTVAIKYTEFGAFYQYTDLRVGNQARSFETAAIANQLAQASGDKERIKRAEQDLIKAFDRFASFRS